MSGRQHQRYVNWSASPRVIHLGANAYDALARGVGKVVNSGPVPVCGFLLAVYVEPIMRTSLRLVATTCKLGSTRSVC